jgi:putative ABC transport system ATP-binding protein
MPKPLIKLDQLCRYFNTNEIETRALHNLNLDIYEGEYVSISGPSGCGKSTLLSILGLLDSPSSGHYWLKEHRVDSFDKHQQAALRNQEIGFVFQAFNLIGDMTVLENVALPLRYSKVSRRQRNQRALQQLEKVNMVHRANHYPAQLSGGQQQRIAVARGIVTEPSILLADEPTGNLDSANGEEIMQLLSKLNDEGTTLCLVTHDARFAKRANRVISLVDGISQHHT